MKNSKPSPAATFRSMTLAALALNLIFILGCASLALPSRSTVPTMAAMTRGTPTHTPLPSPTYDPNSPTLIPIDDTPVPTPIYSAPPPMTIDVNKQYFAVFKMEKGGEFVAQLFPDKAPITVNNFVFLVRAGFYNGTTFHRVLEGFMAQGGDPSGTGMGGPGYTFVNEDSDLKFDQPGILAMANAGRDTNGSQFFITFAPAEWLNGGYTIFGQVIRGMDVVLGITLRDPQQFPAYRGDVIETITIEEK